MSPTQKGDSPVISPGRTYPRIMCLPPPAQGSAIGEPMTVAPSAGCQLRPAIFRPLMSRSVPGIGKRTPLLGYGHRLLNQVQTHLLPPSLLVSDVYIPPPSLNWGGGVVTVEGCPLEDHVTVGASGSETVSLLYNHYYIPHMTVDEMN